MTQNAERPPLSVASTWLGLIRCFPGLYSLTAALRIIIFVGVINLIGPFRETQSGAIRYPVTIQLLDNALDAVLSGMTAVATLRSETAGDRWFVPSTAIREVDSETVVTVVRGQERLPLAVTPEGLHGEWTIVRSAGLQHGDEVVGAIAPFGEELGRRYRLFF